MSGYKSGGTFTQWNTTQQHTRGNSYLWDSIDGPGDYYAKWNKPVSERCTYTIWSQLYVESSEQNKLMNKIKSEA